MNPLYRLWWQFLMELQPIVRYGAERLPRLAPWGVRLRSLFHWLIGSPIQTLATIDGLVLWPLLGLPWRWLAVALAVIHVAVSVVQRVRYRHGGWLIGWHDAWRFRRRWPSVWATVAAKTARVQAEVGTSNEPIASAVLRPVADHPKLSWLPQIEWPIVSWWVGPPPGRSLLALDDLAVVLAANVPRAADVQVDYERENDSHGRLIVSFGDTNVVTTPPWHQPIDASDGALIGSLDDAIAAFDDQNIAAYPPLRAVDGEVS